MMKVKFYGTRGSIPVSEPGFAEFGGNSTCVMVLGPERAGILDAGSGIRRLGKDIFASNDERFKKKMWMLFSHFHWDHIQGLPFFGPAYDPSREFIVCALGKDRMKQDLRSIFAGQMDSVYTEHHLVFEKSLRSSCLNSLGSFEKSTACGILPGIIG